MAENKVFWEILPSYKKKSKETTRVISSRGVFGGDILSESLSLAKGDRHFKYYKKLAPALKAYFSWLLTLTSELTSCN